MKVNFGPNSFLGFRRGRSKGHKGLVNADMYVYMAQFNIMYENEAQVVVFFLFVHSGFNIVCHLCISIICSSTMTLN